MKTRKFFLLLLAVNFLFFSCNTEEEETIGVSSISFKKDFLELNATESAACVININPQNASVDESLLKYEIIPSDICSIETSDSSGCVIKGIKRGSGVLTVSYENIKAYLQLEVNEELVSSYSYISLPEVDVKIECGRKRTVIANLVGASESDISNFIWESSDKSIVDLEYSGSTAVLSAKKYGSAVITVSNPSCEYSASMIVVVPEKEGDIFYLTTENNVLNVLKTETKDFEVSITGGSDNDYAAISYQITSGSENFSVSGSGRNYSVVPKKSGSGVIEFIHPNTQIKLQVVVNIIDDSIEDRIIADSDFLYFDKREEKSVLLSLLSKQNGEWSYTLSESGIIDIIFINNEMMIEPLREGVCSIFVSNTLVSESKEIKVVVENIFLQSNFYAINTSFPVLKMCVGDDYSELDMKLLGGNESDSNSFNWKVSDSSILNVETNNGSVTYDRSALSDESFINGKAFVKGVGEGHGTIEVSHPKSQNSCIVDVFVYPEGTFGENYVDIKGESFVKAVIGEEGIYEVSGDIDFSTISVDVSDPSVLECSVSGNSIYYKGLKKGSACVTLDSPLLRKPWSFNVWCDEKEGSESNVSLITSDTSSVSGMSGSCVNFKIDGDFSKGIGKVSLVCENENVCKAFSVENIICLELNEEGSTVLRINVEGFSNTLLIPIYCTKKVTSSAYPYEFYGDSFVSLNCEKYTELNLSIKGNESALSECEYVYDDESVEFKTENNKLYVKGLKSGRGKIEISHPKVSDKKSISYVIYNTEKESESEYEVWCENTVYSGIVGDEVLIKINQSDNSVHEYSFDVEDMDLVEFSSEGNYLLLKYLKEGSTKLNIRYAEGKVLTLLFRIYEKNTFTNEFSFKLPFLVQGVKGEEFSILYESSEDKDSLDSLLKWTIPESFTYSLISGGVKCLVKDVGEYEIKCESESFGINKKCSVIIYDSVEQLKNDQRILLSDTSYYINEGGEINLEAYLSSSSDENILSRLEWKIKEESEGVSFSGSGKNCYIKGKAEGVYNFLISSPDIESVFNFTVYVTKTENKSLINFDFKRRVFLVPGVVGTYDFSIDKDILSESDFDNVIVESSDLNLEAKVSGSKVVLYCENEGEYYCTLKRNGVGDYKFLVICSESEAEESDYLFTSEKSIVMNVLEEKEIDLYTNCEDFSNIVVSVSGDNCIKVEKKEGILSLISLIEGECSIKLSYNEKSYEIYVKVKEGKGGANDNIVCADFLYVKKGESVDSYVLCKDTVKYEWNSSYIELSENGNNFTVKGCRPGLSEIKVYTEDSCYRMIKVFVYEKETEIENNNFINVSKRKYSVKKGETVVISPYISGSDVDKIDYEVNGDDLDVECEKGIYKLCFTQEGYSSVKFNYYTDSVSVNFYCFGEISEDDENSDDGGIEDYEYYINGEENYAFVKIDDAKTFSIDIKDFEGNSYSDFSNLLWTVSDTSVASISPFSNMCTVRGLKKGRVQLYCSSLECANIFIIQIDVGTENDYYEKTYSFIKVSSSVVSLNVKESVSFEAEFINVEKEDYESFKYSIDNADLCNLFYTISGDKIIFTLEGVNCGKAVIKLYADNISFETTLTVIVSSVKDGNNVYLTTSQNYSLMRSGETKSLSVSLKNYEENNQKNYSWTKISGSDCVTLIGNGSDIQVYAVKEGLCEIEVTHIPSSSSIILYVNVSDSEKSIKYMTTDSLIIEDKVSSQMDCFTCYIVGGDDSDNSKFKFSIDDSSILSVVNNGNTFYYRGLREGSAKVHISAEEGGCVNALDIVFIISGEKSSYMMSADSSSLYLKKNGSSKAVDVSFTNCPSINENLIEWFIYSSVSSEGNVVSIVSSGSRCVIKPLNTGYATVRANYAPLSLSCSIGIYVDEVGKVCFKSENVEIEKGESTFVEVTIPEYMDDISSYITYQSLDESVCRAFGTGRVCCIEGLEKGSCIVRAVNSIDNSVSEIGVSIVEVSSEESVLALSKNTLLLNPRSKNQYLSASIFGSGIKAFDGEDIEWEIISDTTKCLSLYPSTGENVELKLSTCTDSNDSEYGKVKSGQALIKVSHPSCSIYKTVYVCIEEDDNFFTLDKYSDKISVAGTSQIKCNILNGKTSDYTDVQWTISGYSTDQYGNQVDVARLLTSSGQVCNVYGLNDGTCTVTAFYFGSFVSCELTVSEDKTFKINGASSIKMFPDVSDENYTDISYILRPSSAVISWAVQNNDSDSDETILTLEEFPSQQKIRLRPTGLEGSCKVVGFAVGIGQVILNVVTKYEPSLVLPDGETSFTIKMDKTKEESFSFTSYPSIYTVGVSIAEEYKDVLDVYITDEEVKDGYKKGKVCIRAKKETPDVKITLAQYKDNGKKSMAESLDVTCNAYYNNNEIYLGWRKGLGDFSMRSAQNEAKVLYDVSDKFITSGDKTYYKILSEDMNNDNADNAKKIDLAEGEQHYFVLKTKYENTYFKDLNVSIQVPDNNESSVNTEKGFCKNVPKLNSIKNKFLKLSVEDGKVIDGGGYLSSYVFDISTFYNNDASNKYGSNYWLKEDGLGNVIFSTYSKEASKYCCSKIEYTVPMVKSSLFGTGKYANEIEFIGSKSGSDLGSLDNVKCFTLSDGGSMILASYTPKFKTDGELIKIASSINYPPKPGYEKSEPLQYDDEDNSYRKWYHFWREDGYYTYTIQTHASGPGAPSTIIVSSKGFSSHAVDTYTRDWISESEIYKITTQATLKDEVHKDMGIVCLTDQHVMDNKFYVFPSLGNVSLDCYMLEFGGKTFYLLKFHFPNDVCGSLSGKTKYRMFEISADAPGGEGGYFYGETSNCCFTDLGLQVHFAKSDGKYYAMSSLSEDGTEVLMTESGINAISDSLCSIKGTKSESLMRDGFVKDQKWSAYYNVIDDDTKESKQVDCILKADFYREGEKTFRYIKDFNSVHGTYSKFPIKDLYAGVKDVIINTSYADGKLNKEEIYEMDEKEKEIVNYIKAGKKDAITYYYDKDEVFDIKYSGFNLVINYTIAANEDPITKIIPMTFSFYNNKYADFYTNENHKNSEKNENISDINWYEEN